MPRDASRSRSRGKDESKQEAPRAGNSETEIVNVAIKQLPPDIRERLEKLFEEGLLKEGDLDLRSITVFASLNEGLQSRVMNHMETERIYVANARSKSGFLIATCDKAKTGCLDARGLGAIDPWRTALVAMATPKQRLFELKPEQDWLDIKGESPIKINVDVSDVENELGMSTVTVELPLSETCAAVKAKLVAMGVRSISANKMKLHADPVGFLKERHSFAFYNLSDGVTLALSARKRAGTKYRADHTVMPKRPKAPPPETKPAPAPAPAASTGPAAAASTGLGAMPSLASLPELPKLPSLMGGTGPGGGLGGLPGLAGMTGMPGLPKSGMPGMSMPGLSSLTMPGHMLGGGLAAMMAKAGGLSGMLGKAGGLGGLPGMPGLGGGLPGMSLGGMPPMAKLGGISPAGAVPKGGGMM
eukprot:TRINITY_DN3086_c0_g1_i2.p1 TRINITY_DN3086_c0_g1~~TRINITY_DN3086_c0_g1_i2.p1  ORF type:complete len:472 (-),score=96.23 TRINITY_DN3086_c0_g1_i2:279-1526(-)